MQHTLNWNTNEVFSNRLQALPSLALQRREPLLRQLVTGSQAAAGEYLTSVIKDFLQLKFSAALAILLCQ